jgi:hypothetical protein
MLLNKLRLTLPCHVSLKFTCQQYTAHKSIPTIINRPDPYAYKWPILTSPLNLHVSRDSVVGIATGYGLDDRGVGVRFPVESRIFSSPRRPDRLWGPPNLLSNGYRG